MSNLLKYKNASTSDMIEYGNTAISEYKAVGQPLQVFTYNSSSVNDFSSSEIILSIVDPIATPKTLDE